MTKTLNTPLLEVALAKAGMNQAKLADRLEVSREAVSKWFQRENFPAPDKLLRIGMLLGLAFEQLVMLPAPTAVPIVSFRRKAARKTKANHLENARETGEFLKRLVQYLPAQELTQPPTLKDPNPNYEYVQSVAARLRTDMGLEKKEVIEFQDLIGKFNALHAVIIPALWGAQEHHGNALNIYLPDSQTTWVFLNLDSNLVDFKFWMAHELGHSLAPAYGGEDGENFADGFAQALLFPQSQAAKLREELSGISVVSKRVLQVFAAAHKHIISPFTIRRALEDFENAHHLDHTDLGVISGFIIAMRKFNDHYSTITQNLFKRDQPEPKDYIMAARKVFTSPFFEALSAFCTEEHGAEHYIRRVLGVTLADAKALLGELHK